MNNKKYSKRIKRNQTNLSINVEREVVSLLNDTKVQEDRVVRLAMLSILGLYCQGVSKEDINRLEIMNATFFSNILENYRPELWQRLSSHEYCVMAEEFCNGLKSMVRAMFITCFKALDDNRLVLDKNLVIILRDSLAEKTRI